MDWHFLLFYIPIKRGYFLRFWRAVNVMLLKTFSLFCFVSSLPHFCCFYITGQAFIKATILLHCRFSKYSKHRSSNDYSTNPLPLTSTDRSVQVTIITSPETLRRCRIFCTNFSPDNTLCKTNQRIFYFHFRTCVFFSFR